MNEVNLYHYLRDGKWMATPSLEIAVKRSQGDNIHIETIMPDGKVVKKNVIVEN